MMDRSWIFCLKSHHSGNWVYMYKRYSIFSGMHLKEKNAEFHSEMWLSPTAIKAPDFFFIGKKVHKHCGSSCYEPSKVISSLPACLLSFSIWNMDSTHNHLPFYPPPLQVVFNFTTIRTTLKKIDLPPTLTLRTVTAYAHSWGQNWGTYMFRMVAIAIWDLPSQLSTRKINGEGKLDLLNCLTHLTAVIRLTSVAGKAVKNWHNSVNNKNKKKM